MIVSKKLVELFSFTHSIKKYLRNQNNEIKFRTILVFIACAIKESECKSDLSFYTMPDVIKLCVDMEILPNINNQTPVYREHKILLQEGFVERLTEKRKYTKQQYCLSIYGRTQLRRIYMYLIRDIYTPL